MHSLDIGSSKQNTVAKLQCKYGPTLSKALICKPKEYL